MCMMLVRMALILAFAFELARMLVRHLVLWIYSGNGKIFKGNEQFCSGNG